MADLNQVLLHDDRRGRGAPCPSCWRPMNRIDHEIGGDVRARPCGCLIQYRITGDTVDVQELPETERGAA